MEYSVLGTEKQQYAQRIKRRIALCIAAACAAAILNVLFTAMRNENTHTVLLWSNILLDILVGWFLIFYISIFIVPQRRLLNLYNGQRSMFQGTVLEITQQTQRIRHLDCVCVTICGGEDERKFFLPSSTPLKLSPGEKVEISAVTNIIVEKTK